MIICLPGREFALVMSVNPTPRTTARLGPNLQRAHLWGRELCRLSSQRHVEQRKQRGRGFNSLPWRRATGPHKRPFWC